MTYVATAHVHARTRLVLAALEFARFALGEGNGRRPADGVSEGSAGCKGKQHQIVFAQRQLPFTGRRRGCRPLRPFTINRGS
jgi:hypothetical protein